MESGIVATRRWLLIDRLKKGDAKRDALMKYAKDNANLSEYDVRTFQRDLKAIREKWKYIITLHRGSGMYRIDLLGESVISDALGRKTSVLAKLVHLDEMGLNEKYWQFSSDASDLLQDELLGILEAIKLERQITFVYKKIADGEKRRYVVSPLYVREYHFRWYLFAKDEDTGLVKLFVIKRIGNLQRGERRADRTRFSELMNQLKNTIGVTNFSDEPQDVLIEVDLSTLRYLDERRLHTSQKILREGTHSGEISFHVVVNNELRMLFLRYGCALRVIKPESLVVRMNDIAVATSKNIKLGKIEKGSASKVFDS